MATYYYVGTEGMVFLRVRNGRLCFPESGDELDFELEEGKKEMKADTKKETRLRIGRKSCSG